MPKGREKADLIIHPIRLQILQILAARPMTTTEIAAALPKVAKSSLYRHVKILLDSNMLEISAARLVKGIQEREYKLAQRPHLGAEDMADLTREDHLRYFMGYVATLMQGYADYLELSEKVDMLADFSGYTEIQFYASHQELIELQTTIQQAFLPLIENEPGNGRRRQKFSIITHPTEYGGKADDDPLE